MNYENIPDRLSDNAIMNDFCIKGHLEYIPEIEKPSIGDIARGVYEGIIAVSPGLREEWGALAYEGRSFNEAYINYVKGDERFFREEPFKYSFLRDRIFFGKEYIDPMLEKTSGDLFECIDTNDLYITKAVELIQENVNLKENLWEKLTLEQREVVLHDLSDKIADILGVTVSKLKFTDMATNDRGAYTPTDKSITINSDVLTNPEKLRDAINTILHETRHAFQHKTAFEGMADKMDLETSALWRHNIEHYIPAYLDFEAYWNQPIEIDARNFAESVLGSVRL